MSQTRLNVTHLLAAVTSMILLALASPASADALQDIGKLVKQGQHAQALEQVDKYLAGNPRMLRAGFSRASSSPR
jgi:hypothetical protein